MPAFFTCPACKQKNYGQKEAPEDRSYFEGLVCQRCGITGIYWVANDSMAKLLAEQEKVPANRIAIGVEQSPIEYIAPEVAGDRDKTILGRLGPSAKLEAPYSQGTRTKKFMPSATLVKEGQCEGQCLHWIRRVLQGGKETYKADPDKKYSDEEIVHKQIRQHKAGAVTHLLHRKAQTAAYDSFNKAASGARDRYNEEVRTFKETLQNRPAQYEELKRKFEAILDGMGIKKTPTGYSYPRSLEAQATQAFAKWDAIVEKWESQEPTAPQLGATPEWSYAAFWTKFAGEMDSFLDQKMKVSKRRFSNITVVKSVDRLPHDTAGEFVAALIGDIAFGPGTCALLSVGLTKGIGEGGQPIPGHAIAAHFKSTNEFYLFDPNLGIFSSNAKPQFQQTLVSMLGKVWVTDLKWQLEGKYGYSLFRKDSGGGANTQKRAVPFSENPQYTAAENKAEGNIPK